MLCRWWFSAVTPIATKYRRPTMVGVQQTFSWVVDEAAWLAHTRGLMFGSNLVLAAVPILLAGLLFRPAARRGALWWVGLVGFVLLLPNAAYVLTDVVHLLSDVRAGVSDLSLLTVYGPVYALFFALGFSSYVVSLMRMQDYLRDVAPRMWWWPVEISLHALVAVGIFLGRMLRFNSWDAVASPVALTEAVPVMATRFGMLFILFTFAVVAALTALVRPALRLATEWGRRVGRSIEVRLHRIAGTT